MKDPEEKRYAKNLIFYKIDSFLRENRLELGFAITDDILDLELTKLSMNKDIFESTIQFHKYLIAFICFVRITLNDDVKSDKNLLSN